MKKLLVLAVLYQLYLVTRAPCGLSAESLLAGRAILQGHVPYRDFLLHVGPLAAYLFAGLFWVPAYAWCSLVFIGFNLLTAWGIYELGDVSSAGKRPSYECDRGLARKDHNLTFPFLLAAALFLLIAPLYGGNEMYIESIMTAFGVWAFVFAQRGQRWAVLAMVVLAVLTKQTGAVFAVALWA